MKIDKKNKQTKHLFGNSTIKIISGAASCSLFLLSTQMFCALQKPFRCEFGFNDCFLCGSKRLRNDKVSWTIQSKWSNLIFFNCCEFFQYLKPFVFSDRLWKLISGQIANSFEALFYFQNWTYHHHCTATNHFQLGTASLFW